MYGLWASRLFTFLIISSGTKAQDSPDRDHNFTIHDNEKVTDSSAKSKNFSDQQYVVEYSDFIDIPSFKKLQNGHFNYYNSVVAIDLNLQNATGSKIKINICCSWNYYFDVNRLDCVKYKENSQSAEKKLKNFSNKINNNRNGSDYLFIKSRPSCGNVSVLSLDIVPKVRIGSHGIIINGSRVFSEYCIDGNSEFSNETIVLTCNDPEILCKSRACFRKCCPIGESYSEGRKCQKTVSSFNLDFYNLTTFTPEPSTTLFHFGLYLGDACGLKGKYLLEKHLGEMSYLGVDGTLYVPMYEKWFAADSFCMEYVRTGSNSWVGSFLCFSKNPANFENSQLQFVLLSLGLIISCMFLLLTFVAYLFMPKTRNLYGKTLMCYIACLFCAYLGLAAVELKSGELSKTACTNMGYFILFSFLAAFFWLNVMSFDIWKTFRKITDIKDDRRTHYGWRLFNTFFYLQRSTFFSLQDPSVFEKNHLDLLYCRSDRSVERCKTDKRRFQFFKYSIYAWGFPSAITAICAAANQMTNFLYITLKPAIGEESCWFSKKTKAIYVFFIAPISLIIGCNIIFFIQTAWKIWKVKSDVHKLEKQKTKKFLANKDQFIINGKLFVVMGITWSLEIISFFAPHPIWYITDTANALHGVFIFAVFVLKKEVLKEISQKLRLSRNIVPNESSEAVSTKKKNSTLKSEKKTCTTPCE